MSAAGRDNGALAPKRWQERRPDPQREAPPLLPFDADAIITPTPDIDRFAALAKGAIVDLLALLPYDIQRIAASVVCGLWRGFRSA